MPRPPAPDPLEAFSEDEVRTCVAYAKPRQRWALLGAAVDLALLAAAALTIPGRELVRSAAGLAGGWAPGRVALAAIAVVGVRALARLPFSIRAFRQDVRAGLATQRLAGFLLDWLKARAVGLVLVVLPLAGLVLAARWRPPGWPWVAAVAAAVLVAGLALLGPVLIEPLFNRFTSLHPGPLRDRLLALATGMRVPVRDVLVADASRRTTRVNAYVSGLGRTRRVVVYDTLVRSSLQEELALVVAHELAHVRHRDVLWGTLASAAAAAGAVLLAVGLFDLELVHDLLGVGGLGDPLAAPGLLLLAAAGGLLAAPVANLVSRWSEATADWVALEVTGDAATAVAVERRLALENLADLHPNRLLVVLFSSHPPTMARIAQARLWAARHGDYNRAR
ncbi:MAG TPA: M48 family metalloprotease [Actinomycetota bacterium]|nr:M48 family metalloprotease [Actinomycetota bacterium]